MEGGEIVVRASIWTAVLCYPAGPAGRRWAPRAMRMIWTLGGAAFFVHVVSAFGVHYEWSHAVALRETARQTAELTGRAVGAGLYANYVFAALWGLDVVWSWHAPAGHLGRATWIHVALHAFLLFIVFNGTVVFADGFIRWAGLAVTLTGAAALAASCGFRRARGAK